MNMQRTQKVCANGHPMQVDWELCPYCPSPAAAGPELARTVKMDVTELRQGQGQGQGGAAAGGGGWAGSAAPARKTEILERPPQVDGVAWLVGASGAQRGRTHRIEKDRTVVGAAAHCDIVLIGDHVSEQHASFRFQDRSFVVTDLDSTNGTRVNGQAVHQETLTDGDRISLGGEDWVFKCVVFDEA